MLAGGWGTSCCRSWARCGPEPQASAHAGKALPQRSRVPCGFRAPKSAGCCEFLFAWSLLSSCRTGQAYTSATSTSHPQHHALVADGVGITGIRALDFLFERPLVNVNLLAEHLDVTFATANRVAENLQEFGLLEEITGRKRNRVFSYSPYLRLLRGPEASKDSPPGQIETTEAQPKGRLEA